MAMPKLAVKPLYLLAAAGVSCVVCVSALRANNLAMVRLREQVYQADKNNGDVRGALANLQHFVTAHMNTDLTHGRTSVYPPIQLKYTYDRLETARLKASSNEQVYSDAQKYCEAQDPTDFSGHNRVPCIEQYVAAHGKSTAAPIPDSLYKFDFISPTWSPDVAGWSLLLTVCLLLAAGGLWLKHKLNRSAAKQ